MIELKTPSHEVQMYRDRLRAQYAIQWAKTQPAHLWETGPLPDEMVLVVAQMNNGELLGMRNVHGYTPRQTQAEAVRRGLRQFVVRWIMVGD